MEKVLEFQIFSSHHQHEKAVLEKIFTAVPVTSYTGIPANKSVWLYKKPEVTLWIVLEIRTHVFIYCSLNISPLLFFAHISKNNRGHLCFFKKQRWPLFYTQTKNRGHLCFSDSGKGTKIFIVKRSSKEILLPWFFLLNKKKASTVSRRRPASVIAH